uniref:1-aminocyclopropane-1-carboxylate synthase 4 n=1 Tax=Solanum tuberosum TaxID=4113 RepID=M1BYG1_SOLTU|nr:1-aminocyclopropane-1-carboxylate synthase 4-like protein [Solanum tuberosum]
MNGFFLLVAKLQLCYQLLLLLLPNFVRRNLLAIREVFVITSNVVLSELATNEQHGENSLYFEGWKAYNKDPFDLKDNPNGIIQLGLAENQLSVSMIEDWNKRNLQAFIFSITNQDHGLFERLINGIAKLMEKTRGGNVKFDAERIVLTAGATAANETLISCLADPEDAFLIPAPYYTGFDRDLCWRTGVQLVPISCNNFKITIEAVKEAYEKAQKANIKLKGLILTNPSNPLGTVLDRDTLKNILTFTNDLVCDEVYAGTVFDAPRFVSIAEIIKENEIYVNKNLVHIVSSLSKDMGLPGFRAGILYSFNDDVVNFARKRSNIGDLNETQHFLASMLADDEFVQEFLTESGKRLRKRHEKFSSGLEKIGIKCLKSNAGWI